MTTTRPPLATEEPIANAADRGPAPSPCVGVCRIVESEARCAGCLRTLGEIASWGGLDDSARHALLDELAERRHAAGSSSGAERE